MRGMHWFRVLTASCGIVFPGLVVDCAAANREFVSALNRPRLAVIPFVQAGEVAPAEKNAGGTLAERFAAGVDSEAYEVVDGARLRSLLAAQQLRESDLAANDAKAAGFGKRTDIKYLVLGTLSRAGGSYDLQVRLVECESGKVLKAARATFASMDAAASPLSELISKLGLRVMENKIQTEVSAPPSPPRRRAIPRPPGHWGGVVKSAPPAPTERPLWIVGKFTAREGWLRSQTQLEALGKDWGAALAVCVEQALKKRSVRTDISKNELTEAEIRRLVQEGLKYYCGGELELLETSGSAGGDLTAKLVVTYRLQKLFQEKLRTIQQSRISVAQTSSRTVSEEDLRRLLEAAAEEIAKRVVTDIPADLLASRG